MTELDPKLKRTIDLMTYEQMLRLWRFGSSSDRLLQGAEGEYFAAAMRVKKIAVGDAEAVRTSKLIGL